MYKEHMMNLLTSIRPAKGPVVAGKIAALRGGYLPFVKKVDPALSRSVKKENN